MLNKISDIKDISEGDEELMEGANKLYNLTDDIGTIGLYDREKRMREEAEMIASYREKKGLERGIEQGLEQSKMHIAKNLLDMKLSKEDVIKATGISEKEIKALIS